MGQDKKQLSKLLAFVKDIYENPDNKEFAAGIQAMVAADEDFRKRLAETGGADGGLRHIEEYLSLDFGIDSRDLEDYSFVTDTKVREQLLSDYREMLRYQFGTRSHKVDFLEFCRFAHLQTEMLVNYYFEKAFGGDFGKMVAAMRVNYPGLIVSDKSTDISGIAFKSKIFYIADVFGLDNWEKNAILHVYEVRNRQSHRSLRVDRDLICDTENRLKKENAWMKYGKPDFAKAVSIIGQDVLNEYKFQVWFDRQPFKEVTANLKRLSDAVQEALL